MGMVSLASAIAINSFTLLSPFGMSAPHALNAEATRDRITFLAGQLSFKPPDHKAISAIPALGQRPGQSSSVGIGTLVSRRAVIRLRPVSRGWSNDSHEHGQGLQKLHVLFACAVEGVRRAAYARSGTLW
jgi:hypothetical protein